MKDTAPAYDEAAVMAEIFAEIERLHDYWRNYTPPASRWRIPEGTTAADTICHTCRGFGHLTDVHEYGDPTHPPCHRCGGTGIKP